MGAAGLEEVLLLGVVVDLGVEVVVVEGVVVRGEVVVEGVLE